MNKIDEFVAILDKLVESIEAITDPDENVGFFVERGPWLK